jgi:hypothetical protein
MTATIYARVADDLKSATDQYATERGMSLASAVSDLLSRGLEAAANEAASGGLERRNQELQRELAHVRQAAVAVDERLKQVLGICQCGSPLTGNDLLVTGRCPTCSRGVGALLAGTDESAGSVNRNEFAPFIAGIGVALALVVLAYAASQE